MLEVFTINSFFIVQQSFRVFPIHKFSYYPFIMNSTISWERERESRWHPSVSLTSTFIPNFLQILITVVSRSSSWMLFGMADSFSLFLQLYWSPFAWFFSKNIIFSPNLLLTFCITTSSLLSSLFYRLIDGNIYNF